MEWFEKKFQGKVNEKISSEIALSQVELVKNIEKTKTILQNVFSLYKKLCDFSYLTQEKSQRILCLQRNLKISGMQLPQSPAQSENHFHIVLHTQKELVVLKIEEGKLRSKLVNIQASLTPHMGILQKN